jgi:hypothetical protein
MPLKVIAATKYEEQLRRAAMGEQTMDDSHTDSTSSH